MDQSMPVEALPATPCLQAGPATARIAAVFRRVRGATQLAQASYTAPLKIGKTFPLRAGQLGVCVMDCSPGLLAGDCYEMDWRLEAGTKVHLANQSFTRVHPSRDSPTAQRQRIVVGADALLEYLPEPVMLFRDAALRVSCDITLEPGSILLMSDILCAGRTRRDEAFQFHEYHSRLRVCHNGELIHANQVRHCPGQHNPRMVGAWGHSTHAGNFYVFCDRLEAAEWEQLVSRLRQVADRHPHLLSGVSLTYRHGLIVSMLGHRAWDVQTMVRQVREVTRCFMAATGASHSGDLVASTNDMPAHIQEVEDAA